MEEQSEHVGELSDDVPTIEPDGDCNGKRTERRDGETIFVGYCAQPEGWGRGPEHTEGRCKHHGGGNSGQEGNNGGAPPRNTNAVTHALYAQTNAVYQQVFSDDIRELVNKIFIDYIEEYEDRHGEPPYGHEAELFRISVSHGKHVHSEQWAVDKPGETKSGNAMVDKETSVKTTVDRALTEESYQQTVVQKGQKQLSQDRRMWLKDLGLLDDPESQKADAQEDMADAWREALTEG